MVFQEFKEGRRASQTAPQVLFSHRDPPRELEGTGAKTGDNIGYITFGMIKWLFDFNNYVFDTSWHVLYKTKIITVLKNFFIYIKYV